MFTLMVCMRPKCTKVYQLTVFLVGRGLWFKTVENQDKQRKINLQENYCLQIFHSKE